MSDELRPADRLAALLALKAGLDDQIAAAKRDVVEVAQQTSCDRFVTRWGRVNVTSRDAAVEVTDSAALLRWVKEHRPDEVETVETVRPAFLKHLREERWVVMKGEVFDSHTGEPVPFAALGEPGDPFPAWPASTQQRDAKDYARMLFADNADRLTAGLVQITEGEA